MKTALLDANVLLALLDSQHSGHATAREWFARDGRSGWASCAITQNGFLRISSQPRYTNPVSLRDAVARLRSACSTPIHAFWPCDVSLVDIAAVDDTRLLGPSQITDVYLLALAVAHDGRLVTLDRTVPLGAVVGATEDHLVAL